MSSTLFYLLPFVVVLVGTRPTSAQNVSNTTATTTKQPERVCPKKCSLTFRCDAYYSGPPVWTIADGYCKIMKTDCFLVAENCQRQNKCLPKLIRIKKEECQPRCIRPCAGESKDVAATPICAYFPIENSQGDRENEKITFASRCELENYACSNSKAHSHTSEGACV